MPLTVNMQKKIFLRTGEQSRGSRQYVQLKEGITVRLCPTQFRRKRPPSVHESQKAFPEIVPQFLQQRMVFGQKGKCRALQIVAGAVIVWMNPFLLSETAGCQPCQIAGEPLFYSCCGFRIKSFAKRFLTDCESRFREMDGVNHADTAP